MNNFDKFAEALLLSVVPSSDSVGSVVGCDGRGRMINNDMLTTATNDMLKQLGVDSDNTIQPEDDIGEVGEIQASTGEGDDGVSVERDGDSVKVCFNDMEVVLPQTVIDKILELEGVEIEEGAGGEETDNTENDEDIDISEDNNTNEIE